MSDERPQVEPAEGDGTDPAPAGSTAVAERRNLKRVYAAVAGTVGLVSGVLGIWPVVFSDGTGIDNAELSVEPFRPGEVHHYALPVGTDLSTFPAGGSVCTGEQKQWLDAHGIPFQRDYMVEMRNTAGGGSALSLDDLRGDGESTPPAERRVAVQCNMSGESGVVSEPARVDPVTGQGAFFDTTAQGGGQGRGQAHTPVAFNLQPGEVGQIVLTVSSTMDFTGDLVAEVAVGQDSEVRAFRSADAEALTVPGVESPRSLVFDVKNGGLRCRIVPNATDNGRSTCTVEEYFTTRGG